MQFNFYENNSLINLIILYVIHVKVSEEHFLLIRNSFVLMT